MREERGIIALLTVAFLAFVGALAIAFVLASARVNNAYSLMNGAAQAAAFSAATSTGVQDGKALIPCDIIQTVRQTDASGCFAGDSHEAARELMENIFADKPSGFCFSNCEAGDIPVYMGERDASWIQVFNIEEGQPECSTSDFLADIDGVNVAGTVPPRFRCWVVREDARDRPYSIKYSSGVIVRLRARLDLFLFRDRELEVFAGATIAQGE